MAPWLVGALRTAASFGFDETGGVLSVMNGDLHQLSEARLARVDQNLTRSIAFTDYDLYILAQRTLPADQRRLVETFMITRGYTAKKLLRVRRTKQRALPDLREINYRVTHERIRSPKVWRRPWTLARVLLDPVTALISNDQPGVAAEIQRAGSLAGYALDTNAFQNFITGPRWLNRSNEWDLADVVNTLEDPSVRSFLRRLPQVTFQVGDLEYQKQVETALIRSAPWLFGRLVGDFTDEKIVSAMKRNPLHQSLFLAQLIRAGPLAPTARCEVDLVRPKDAR